MYQVKIRKTAFKELRSLPTAEIQSITNKIDELAIDPRPNGCKKLKGQKDLWRIRSGDYRIIYSIDGEVRIVDIRKIGHRRDIYE